MLPPHPAIERIVKKKIRQHWADDRPLRGPPFSVHQGPIRHAYGRLEPSLKVEKHPFAVRVPSHGSHQEVPVDLIEEALDIKVKHPVMVPTSPSGHAQCLVRRFPWTISIGILVKSGFQDWFQVSFDDPLGDSVGDRWNAKRPGPSQNLPSVCQRDARVTESSFRSTSDSRSDRGSYSGPRRNPR